MTRLMADIAVIGWSIYWLVAVVMHFNNPDDTAPEGMLYLALFVLFIEIAGLRGERRKV